MDKIKYFHCHCHILPLACPSVILHEEQFTCAEGEDKADPYKLWTKIGPYVCLKNQKLCRLSTPNEVIKHNQMCSKTLN